MRRLRRAAAYGVAAQRHGEQREEERAEHDLDAEPEAGDEEGGLVRPPESAEAVRRPLRSDRDEADERRERRARFR